MGEPDGSWRIVVRPKARRTLRRLPLPLRQRISEVIDQLASDPRPIGSKKLAGVRDLYRVRVGEWRILYVIEDDQLIVIVVDVAPRGRAYRNL